jgi:hypothetical protein
VRIGVRCRDLQLDATVVGDRHERVDGVQLAVGVVGIVHPGHAQAQLEPQLRMVAKRLRYRGQLLAPHLERQLVAEDHDTFDRGGKGVLTERTGEGIYDLVKVAAVRPR